jgi:hypothetical protein
MRVTDAFPIVAELEESIFCLTEQGAPPLLKDSFHYE